MENTNFFLWIKAAAVAACGAFGAAFGWVGWLVLAWVCCMALDWISGSAAAAAKGRWSSAVARAGIWHKGGMILVVLVAAVTDCVLGVAVALGWYIFTELGSIAENATAMGAPVPGWLIGLLEAGRQAADEQRP